MPSDCLAVGHRGFKGKHTENTIHGFERCFATGATIFETDVWVTKDGVLVISHDVNTKRVFCDENGQETDYNILDTNYEQLKPLRTIGSGEPLMTFRELLGWFSAYVKETAHPEYRISLDLKNANPPRLLRLLFEDLLAVHDDLSWWYPRIQIGLWNLRFLKYLNQDEYFQGLFANRPSYDGFSGFDIYHISLSWQDSMVFLAYNEYLDTLEDRVKFKVAGVSLIHVSTWSREFLEVFMPAMKKQHLNMYTWTVNHVTQLRYFCAVARAWGLTEYGVITDYPDVMVDAVSRGSWKQESAESLVVPRSLTFYSWIMRVVMYFSRPPQLSTKPSFDSHVAPHETLFVKPRLGSKIFALLQAWGIF